MSVRDPLSRGSARKGLAASLSLGLVVAAVVGCDATTNTDKAVATVNEPLASGSPTAATTAAPSGESSEAAPAKGTEAPAKGNEKAAEAPAAASNASGWGTLKGRVVFGGDAPTPKVLVAKGDKNAKDPEVCAKQEIDSQRLVVNKGNKGVRYAIVYIPKPTAVNKDAEAAAKKADVVFDQEHCTFSPHVLVAMKGATVQIKTSDAVGHNADAVGLINNRFNLTTPPGSPPVPVTLKAESKPGKVGCDIHPWMESYWFAPNSPYFAVTDENGNFEIKDVPAGDQKVVVWAEALGPGFITPGSGESVTIKADGETSKDWTLDPAKVK